MADQNQNQFSDWTPVLPQQAAPTASQQSSASQGKPEDWEPLKFSPAEEHQMRVELVRPEMEKRAVETGPVAAAMPSFYSVPILGPLYEKGAAYGQAATGLRPAEGATIEEKYRNILAENEALRQAQKTIYPKASAVKETGEMGAAMLATPSLGVESALTKVAPSLGRAIPLTSQMIESGIYGGLSNVYGGPPGESYEDAVKRVATDAGFGTAAPIVVKGISKIGVGGLKKGYNFVSDIFNPEGAEYRALAVGAREIPGKVSAEGISPEEYAQRKAAGEDVSLMDVQGVKPRVAQAAARLPEEENIRNINVNLQKRFEESGKKFGDSVDAIWGRPIDPYAIRSESQAAARASNNPLYENAFNQPNAQAIWNPNLQTMINTDAGQKALESAFERAKIDSFNKGVPFPAWPFVKDQNGQWTMQQGITPNLRFWDYVKQGLNDVVGKQRADGDRAYGATSEMTKNFTKFLKDTVPEYDAAVSNAGKFIRGDNAFDEGLNFFNLANVTKKTPPDQVMEVNKLLNNFDRKFSDTEREQMAMGLTSYIKENPYDAAKVFARNDKGTMDRFKKVLGDDRFYAIDDALRVERLAAMTKEIGAASQNKNIYGPIIAAGGIGVILGSAAYNFPQIFQYVKDNPFAAMGVGTVLAVGELGRRGLSAQGNRKAAALLSMAAADDEKVAQRLLDASQKDARVRLALKTLEAQVSRTYAALHSQQEAPPAGERANGGRIARASGGSVDALRGARALMRAAENAKKNISKTTEALLDQPDEHIAQTLNAAKRHI